MVVRRGRDSDLSLVPLLEVFEKSRELVSENDQTHRERDEEEHDQRINHLDVPTSLGLPSLRRSSTSREAQDVA